MDNYKVNVEINSEVNELFAKTNVIQIFKNPESKPLELKVYVYKKEGIIFSSFSAQIGDSIKVQSIIIKKEKAEEKYTDSISSGNASIYVNEDKSYNRIVINMGNIPPKKEIILISEFIQLTENSKTYEFELFRNLPIFIGVNSTFQNGYLKGKVQIKTKNKILKLRKQILFKNLEIIKEKNQGKEKKNNFLFQYQIRKLPEYKEQKYLFNKNYEYIPSSKLYFFTEEKGHNSPIVYCQKSNLNKNEKSYIIHYIKKIDNLGIIPGLFIFLIDQSGSMEGQSINLVSEALEIFLQSIPTGSYYQLIGFGSNFIKYDKIPKSYTKENIKNSLTVIKDLEANLGGTNIYEPLKDIYENEKIYNEIKLPKNIFLLTDGEIDDKRETLELIEKYSSKFSIFSIGIGNYFDKDLIKNAGIIGKGGYNFCYNLEGLNAMIVNEIKKCTSPYISNFKMKSSLDEKYLYKAFEVPEIVKNTQVINVGYIVKDNDKDNYNNKIKINIEYFDDKNKKENYELIPEKIKEGDELSKLIINNYLTKNLSSIDKKNLSLKYQILTEYTSLFAEIELSNKISKKLKAKIIGGKKNEPNIHKKNINVEEEKTDNRSIKQLKPKNIMRQDLCYLESYEDLKSKSSIDPPKEMCFDKSPGKTYLKKRHFYKCYNIFPYISYCCRAKCYNIFYSISSCCKINCYNLFSSINGCCKRKKKPKYNFNLEEEERKNKNNFIEINDASSDINTDIRFNVNETNENNNNKLKKDELMKIINTQDFIDGFWENNNQTKYVKEKYEKEYEILKSCKIINNNDKILITILIIYYIEIEYPELLNELSLIIEKGKIFIKKETKSSFEEIIKEIETN